MPIAEICISLICRDSCQSSHSSYCAFPAFLLLNFLPPCRFGDLLRLIFFNCRPAMTERHVSGLAMASRLAAFISPHHAKALPIQPEVAGYGAAQAVMTHCTSEVVCLTELSHAGAIKLSAAQWEKAAFTFCPPFCESFAAMSTCSMPQCVHRDVRACCQQMHGCVALVLVHCV
jgi:hypothetical protein